MAKRDIQQKKKNKEDTDVYDLEHFIEKKKIQNEALKKIIEKIEKPKTTVKKKY